jgi:RNA polymerase sigma-70 factor (ECF subfamily)|tara:strand:+ start:528 stop:1100 length:573 start_codon:yes stop_codon:yes gene_type:complete
MDKSVVVLDLIADGHPGSFEMLIEKYGNLVWSIGKKFLYNQSDLEDGVQEVMIAIWKSADKFDQNKASEITFISMIARRRFIDYLRKITKHKSEDSLDDENKHIHLYKESLLNEETDLSLVKSAIEELDTDDQELLNLSVYQGYSHSEISDILNIPLGTVKTRIRRNLMKLKDAFATNKRKSKVIQLQNG